MTPNDFIQTLLSSAVQIQLEYDLPAAAMIAQAANETGWGRFVTKDMYTGRDSKNLFNIKGNGPAGHVSAKTREYINGQWITTIAQFRAYNNYAESFRDYATFIKSNERYAPALKVKSDPIAYIRQLQQCGYATDPNYSQQIISIMQQYNIIGEVQKYMDTPSDWAKGSWDKAVKEGIFDGTEPKGVVTREMMAVVLDRVGLLNGTKISQSVVDVLKKMGVISGNHLAEDVVHWGELAVVINKIKEDK